MNTESDGELAQRAQNGDSEAFGILVRRYLSTISLLAYQKVGHRNDAEDIAQETFVRAFRSLKNLKDPNKFGAWVYNIAFRLSIDWLRKRSGRKPQISYDELVEKGVAPFDETREKDQIALAEKKSNLEEALTALPDRYRLVLTLRYIKQMSYKEIAKHLKEPEGTIANRLHRATGLLRDRMSREARK